MKVNRLGKAVLESGLRFKEFLRFHNIGCKYITFYGWCTTAQTTPQETNMVYIDRIASALGTTRIDVLNMISDKSTYDIEFHRDPNKNVTIEQAPTIVEENNFLKQLRKEKGLTVAQVADMIGLEKKQILTDIENGKRRHFPSVSNLNEYLKLFDISFAQFQKTIKDLCEDRNSKLKEEKIKRNSPSDDMDNVDDSVREELEPENPYVSIFMKMGEQPNDGCIENPDREITEVDIPEEPHTPFQDACKILYGLPRTPYKAVLSEATINKVMELIYGQVDYITYKQVEETLKGVNE